MKTLMTLVAGLMLGSAAALLHGPIPNVSPLTILPDGQQLAASLEAPNEGVIQTETPAVSDGLPLLGPRLAHYRAVSQFNDPIGLVLWIEQLNSQAIDGSRDAELEAVVMRLAEIDPARAVDTTMRLGLRHEFVGLAFSAWMAADPDVASAAVRALRDPATARFVLMTLIEFFQDDHVTLDRITTMVSRDDLLNVRIDVLVQHAQADPGNSLRKALLLDEHDAQARAVRHIAAVWARRDPTGALREAANIPDSTIRNLFRYGVLAEWSRLDPSGALDYIVSDPQQPELSTPLALQMIAASDPERLLAVAERLPPRFRTTFRTEALRVLADRDLSVLISLLGSLPVGEDRRLLQMVIADAYPRQEGEGAFEWAVATGSLRLQLVTLRQIALNNAVDAIDYALSQPNAAILLTTALLGSGGPPLMSPESVNPGQMPAVADRLLAAGEAYSETMHAMIESWSLADPDGALRWALTTHSTPGTEMVASLARGFATSELEPSAAFLPSLPNELRSRWIEEVAKVYAANDADAALAWLSNHRGDPDYDSWVSATAQQIVFNQNFDAPAAARLLGSALQPPADASGAVASRWALEDPYAATQWAASLADPEARASAFSAAAGAWTIHAPDAAQQWALTQVDGTYRNRALTATLVQGIATHGIVDARVLDAFDGVGARQQAMLESTAALALLHQRDPQTAEALIDAHFSDSVLRLAIDQQRERISALGQILPAPATPLIVR